MTISHPSPRIMRKATAIIKSGGIIAFPTETVYGLGADAFNPLAVARIFEAKNRPLFDPLIVHIANLAQMSQLASRVDKRAGRLAGRFWPGPLTLVLPKNELVPDIVTAGLDTVAVRMPDHLIALDLIHRSGTPIAAPSANRFGYISPTKAAHVLEQLGERVDMIIDGGDCTVGVESTIVKLDGDRNIILRPGGVPIEEIEAMIGPAERVTETEKKPEAPGQFPSHYSPTVPVQLADNIRDIDFSRPDAGFLLFRKPDFDVPLERTEILSIDGDLKEAAANLFSALHLLDKMKIRVIVAEPVPENGLGIAIMDRLRKAARREIGGVDYSS
ncbi:MAG: threonylcarbamoyl-AMP synthase [Spirochaetes bacterium RBG_13_51_14]|nr:MAG: threonylcarbamoyl-AMP synthase [Spirochaetes bacterium RBG_13_51_14]